MNHSRKIRASSFLSTAMFLAMALFITAPLSISRAAEPQKLQTVDCIIVAGQSNAVGYDADPEKLPADEADKETLFWWRCGDPPPDEHDSTSAGKWTHLQAQPLGDPLKDKKVPRQYGNFRSPRGGFGPEMGLARALFHQEENKRVAIIKAAWSGTSVQHDWNAPSTTSKGGDCYRGLIAEVKAAREAATAQGITLRLRALVWVQGESDANPHDAPLYEGGLGDMLVAMRKDLDAPNLPALLSVNIHFGDMKKVTPKMQAIVEAQKAVAAKDAHCVYVDPEGASLANAVHFDAAGTLEMGRRFAAALKRYEKAH